MDNNIMLRIDSNESYWKSKTQLWLRILSRSYKLIFAVTVPIVLLPLLFIDDTAINI
ncbi:unnamed protein product, partial [Medioppia subpectinata]